MIPGWLSLWNDIIGIVKEEVVAHDTSGTPNDIIGSLHGSFDLALFPKWKVRKKQVSPRQDRTAAVHLYTYR